MTGVPIVETHDEGHDWSDTLTATHWQPLPTPPTTSAGGHEGGRDG